MTRWQIWLLHGANLLVGGTGIIYGVMIYFMSSDDPYAVVNHPWQPHLQHFHVLFAPVLVFAVGIIWQRHVLGRLKSPIRSGRFSGMDLIYSLGPMVLSGYLLQTTTHETWHQIWVGVHIASSLAWIAGYLTHQVRAWSFSKRLANRINPSGLEG